MIMHIPISACSCVGHAHAPTRATAVCVCVVLRLPPFAPSTAAAQHPAVSYAPAQHTQCELHCNNQPPPAPPAALILCCLPLLLLLVVSPCHDSADGPVWVLQHNVTTANNVTPVPREPAPAPGTMTPQQIRLQALTRRLIKTHTYDWFMYECPADRLVGRVGRPCSELQEGAVSKAATFFATENARPTEHGNPKVGGEEQL